MQKTIMPTIAVTTSVIPMAKAAIAPRGRVDDPFAAPMGVALYGIGGAIKCIYAGLLSIATDPRVGVRRARRSGG